MWSGRRAAVRHSRRKRGGYSSEYQLSSSQRSKLTIQQAGVNFARKHNLRLSVKASGHDLLGRSTAKSSLLIHTHKLQSIAFTDNFRVGYANHGSAVTVESGVGLSALYNASKEVDKIYVGGSAATVVAAGGYVQGGGHSPLSPLLGLCSDNTLGAD
jgi:FAD/FMN-containing dehydrogenase